MLNKETNDRNVQRNEGTEREMQQKLTERRGRKEKETQRTEKRRLLRYLKDEKKKTEENKREKKKRKILYALPTGIPYYAEPCTVKRMYTC
jgi:hypothetical protein